jgi:hypothetical protein
LLFEFRRRFFDIPVGQPGTSPGAGSSMCGKKQFSEFIHFVRRNLRDPKR